MTDLEKFCQVLNDLGIVYKTFSYGGKIKTAIDIYSESTPVEFIRFLFQRDGSYDNVV